MVILITGLRGWMFLSSYFVCLFICSLIRSHEFIYLHLLCIRNWCWGYRDKQGEPGYLLFLEPVGPDQCEQMPQYLCQAWLVGDSSIHLLTFE